MDKQHAGHNWHLTLSDMLSRLKSGEEISEVELNEMVKTTLLCKEVLDFVREHDLNHDPEPFTIDKLTNQLKYSMIVNG